MNPNVYIKRPPFFVLFLVAFSFVNLLGIINFPIYFDRYDTKDLLVLFFLGLLGFITGYLVSKVVTFSSKPRGSFKEDRFDFIVKAVNILSLIIIAFTHIRSGGIVLLSEDSRFGSFFYVNVIVYAAVLLSVLYVAKELLNDRPLTWKMIGFLAIQCLFALSLGYRSPVIILVCSTLITFYTIHNSHQNKAKRIYSLKNVLVFGFLVYIMGFISAFRVSQKYSLKYYYKNIDAHYVDQNAYLQPFVPTLSLFRYNQWVINKLVDVTETDPMNGGLFASNLKAILPGSHPGARNIVGELIGARLMPNGKHWSTTPTLQGALFVDGGRWLVFFGFFFLTLIIGLCGKAVSRAPSPFNITLYSFFFVSFLMSIHTGYFDLMFYLLIIGVFLFKFIIMRIGPIRIPAQKDE